jgi:hypothetical protein
MALSLPSKMETWGDTSWINITPAKNVQGITLGDEPWHAVVDGMGQSPWGISWSGGQVETAQDVFIDTDLRLIQQGGEDPEAGGICIALCDAGGFTGSGTVRSSIVEPRFLAYPTLIGAYVGIGFHLHPMETVEGGLSPDARLSGMRVAAPSIGLHGPAKKGWPFMGSATLGRHQFPSPAHVSIALNRLEFGCLITVTVNNLEVPELTRRYYPEELPDHLRLVVSATSGHRKYLKSAMANMMVRFMRPFSSADFAAFAGPAGPAGPSGEKGVAGPAGPAGPFGPQGLTGAQGAPGNQGVPGEKGPRGETGPAGAQGAQGTQGNPGEKGPPGETGAQGNQGVSGEKGPRGDTGTTGAQGAQGTQGNPGEKGPPGERGAQGDQGGPGEKGDRGDTGPTGAQGAQGTQGNPGEKGPPGERGAQGDQGVPGEKGDRGDTGPAGAQGAQGTQGNPGEKGPRGEPGAQGNQGVPGEKGPRGEAGPPGPAGPCCCPVDPDTGESIVSRGQNAWANVGTLDVPSVRKVYPANFLTDGDWVKANWDWDSRTPWAGAAQFSIQLGPVLNPPALVKEIIVVSRQDDPKDKPTDDLLFTKHGASSLRVHYQRPPLPGQGTNWLDVVWVTSDQPTPNNRVVRRFKINPPALIYNVSVDIHATPDGNTSPLTQVECVGV